MFTGQLSAKFLRLLICLGAGVACLPALSQACTRCVFLGPDNTVLVARSMDWMEDPGTNIFSFPKGMQRNGAAGPKSVTWTSKYGSVVCAFYEAATVDGMNDQGLVANVLYLVESNYGEPGDKPTLSIAAWAQYVLDHYATVAEAVEALRKEPFVIVAPVLPNGEPAQGHLSISDPSGDSAIFEYIDGKLVIHHGREFQVMTNSPTYDKQLTLDAYWQQIGGAVMLPGTSRAADRFVRASYYLSVLPSTAEEKESTAAIFSLIRSVSVPLGVATAGQPNIANTLWRTVYDQKRKIMYFDSATSPNVFWVPLSDPALKSGNMVQKLELSDGKTYSGNAAAAFQPAKPFEFLPGGKK